MFVLYQRHSYVFILEICPYCHLNRNEILILSTFLPMDLKSNLLKKNKCNSNHIEQVTHNTSYVDNRGPHA